MSGCRQRWQEEWQRLKELDWRALEVKEAGEWPWLLKMLSGCLALGVAFGAVSGWLVGAERKQLAAEQRQEVRLLSEYRLKASQAALLPDVRRRLEALQAQLADSRARLPASVEMPSLLDSISDAALNNQLTVEAIQLQPTSRHAYYMAHPLEIQVRGDYHQLAQFVADISQLTRLVTQHELTLVPAEQYGASLRLSLLARTYSAIAKPEKAL